ncbi:MAG: hypothetical protein Roseis2KO_54260 [Roseivirga sp.]
MRILFTAFLTLFFVKASNAQSDQWPVYELDNRISIELPGEVFEMDTVVKAESLYQLYAEFQGALFIAQIISYEKDSEGRYPGLPSDSGSLEKYYRNVVKGIMNTTQNKLQSSKAVDINGLSGYELVLSFEKKPTRMSRILLVENKLISLVYNDELSFDTDVANMFFKSIDITDIASVNQYPGPSNDILVGETIGKVIGYILTIVLIIFVVRTASKKRNKAQKAEEND